MKKNKKLWLIPLAIFVIVVALICNWVFSIRANEHPTLTVGIYTGSSWNVPNGHQYRMIDYEIKEFKKLHPNVKIEYESGVKPNDYINWLSEKIVTGQIPDIIIMPQNDFNVFASEGTFKNLNPYLTRDHLAKKFYPATLEAGNYQGKQYTLPYETNPRLLVANWELLKKNGFASLNELDSVSKFRQICHYFSLKSGLYGITSDYNWQDAQLAYGSKLFNGKNHQLQLTNSKVRQGLNLIQDLTDDSQVHNVTRTMFDQGKVALLPLSFAQFRTYTTYPYYVTSKPNFQLKTTKMPGNQSTSASTVGFGISSHCQKTELAWQFIKMICSNQKIQQKLMQSQMGCSVMPNVIKSKQTQRLLEQDEATKNSITATELDRILRDEAVTPKFRNYNQIMTELDAEIDRALDEDTLSSQLFTIQWNINREIRSNERGNQ